MEKLYVYRNACKVGEENATGVADDIEVNIFGNTIIVEDADYNRKEYVVTESFMQNNCIVEKIYEITNHKIYYVIDYSDVGRRRIQEVYIYDGENHENYTIIHALESMNVIDNITGDTFIVNNHSDRSLDVLDCLEKYRIINEYMTPAEAAHRWGIEQETVKNKLKPSVVGQDVIDKWIDDGLIKCFQKPGGQRKEWIISQKAMESWFGKK